MTIVKRTILLFVLLACSFGTALPHMGIDTSEFQARRQSVMNAASDGIVLLHFFIATSAATVYYVASRWLAFLKEHWLICGLFYGAAIDQVMTLIVLPLSALQARGPYKLHDLLLGIGVHMITVGLPISFSVWRFGNQSAVSINSSRISR